MTRKYLILFLSLMLCSVALFSSKSLTFAATETSTQAEYNKQILLCNDKTLKDFNDTGAYGIFYIKDKIDTLTPVCTGGTITGAPEDVQAIEIRYKFWVPVCSGGFGGCIQDIAEGSATLYPGNANTPGFKNSAGQYKFCALPPQYLSDSEWNPNPPLQSPPIVTDIIFKGGNNYESQSYPMSESTFCTTSGGTALGNVTLNQRNPTNENYTCQLNADKTETVCKGDKGTVDASRQKCTDSTGELNCKDPHPWFVQCTNTFGGCADNEGECRQDIDAGDSTIRLKDGGPFATYDQCYKVAGGRKVIDLPTPTPTPPPPPCASDTLEKGCTAITSFLPGTISTDPAGFITKLFAIFLSLSGGIALLLIIRSGYQMMTSRGNAEQIKEAQDRITSAIVGLLFIISSLVILQVIGVDILHLPGIGK